VSVGVGNGMMLGHVMRASRAVQRMQPVLEVIGGPLILISGALGISEIVPAGGARQALL